MVMNLNRRSIFRSFEEIVGNHIHGSLNEPPLWNCRVISRQARLRGDDADCRQRDIWSDRKHCKAPFKCFQPHQIRYTTKPNAFPCIVDVRSLPSLSSAFCFVVHIPQYSEQKYFFCTEKQSRCLQCPLIVFVFTGKTFFNMVTAGDKCTMERT